MKGKWNRRIRILQEASEEEEHQMDKCEKYSRSGT